MTGRLPHGAGGPLAGGAPLTDRGPRGGALGAPCIPIFYLYGFMGLVLYRVLDTHFLYS
jgi:hypothetical protein